MCRRFAALLPLGHLHLLIVVSVWKLAERLATERSGIALGLPLLLPVVLLLSVPLRPTISSPAGIFTSVPGTRVTNVELQQIAAEVLSETSSWGLLVPSHRHPLAGPGLPEGNITSMALSTKETLSANNAMEEVIGGEFHRIDTNIPGFSALASEPC